MGEKLRLWGKFRELVSPFQNLLGGFALCGGEPRSLKFGWFHPASTRNYVFKDCLGRRVQDSLGDWRGASMNPRGGAEEVSNPGRESQV